MRVMSGRHGFRSRPAGRAARAALVVGSVVSSRRTRRLRGMPEVAVLCVVAVAHSVRAPVCGTGGSGFESRQPPLHAAGPSMAPAADGAASILPANSRCFTLPGHPWPRQLTGQPASCRRIHAARPRGAKPQRHAGLAGDARPPGTLRLPERCLSFSFPVTRHFLAGASGLDGVARGGAAHAPGAGVRRRAKAGGRERSRRRASG
jgi:hypothetical protein